MPGHRHHNENAGDELLPEEIGTVDVRREDARQALRVHLRQALADRHVELAEQKPDAGQQADQHAGRLQRIGPDDGFHAALVGVHQDHAKDHHGAEPERHPEAVEYYCLQDIHHQVQARRRADQPRQDKKPGTALVGPFAEAHVEIGINRRQLQPVIQRQQDVRDGNVADDVADQNLSVAKPIAPDRTGHADKGHAGQGRPDHPEGHEHPVGAFVTDKKTVVGGIA